MLSRRSCIRRCCIRDVTFERMYVYLLVRGGGNGKLILSCVANSLQLPDLDFGTRELFVLFVICDEESGGEEGYIVRGVRSRA
jgi:hypothetical protein